MLAEFSVAPMDGGTHLSEVVAEMLRIVDASGLPYELHSMGTIVEGEWNEVMTLIGQCHEAALQHGTRVSTAIKIDHARGRTGRLKGKVDAVERLVGKRLSRAAE